MKSSDQKALETLYEQQVFLTEGIWDKMVNAGNRVANVFRSGENQKNPVEAQVQSIWNNFQETVKKHIASFMQKQSHTLDAEDNSKESNTIVTQQIDAIKEAQKFLESPATYLRTKRSLSNNTTQQSPNALPSTQNTRQGQQSLPPSGNQQNQIADNDTIEGEYTVNSDSENNKQEQLALPSSPQRRRNTRTTNASNANQPLDASSTEAPTGSTPEVKKKATQILQDLRKRDKSVYNEIVKRVKYNLARNAKRKAARDAQKNGAIPESYNLNDDSVLIEALDSGAGGLDFLFEYAMTTDVANRVASTANREGEDIRFHGARPIQVELMKFFENFKQAATTFWKNYDAVQKEGTYSRSTASREKFYMIEAFFKQLHKILYIPNGANLQGKDPFIGRVK